jgi:hypothetical protein
MNNLFPIVDDVSVPESSGVDLEGGAIDVDVCDSCY